MGTDTVLTVRSGGDLLFLWLCSLVSTPSPSKAWPHDRSLNVLILNLIRPLQWASPPWLHLLCCSLIVSIPPSFVFVLLSRFLFYQSNRNYCYDFNYPPSTHDSQIVISSSAPKLQTCTLSGLRDTPPSGQFIPNITKCSSSFSSKLLSCDIKTLAFIQSYKRRDCRSPSQLFLLCLQ